MDDSNLARLLRMVGSRVSRLGICRRSRAAGGVLRCSMPLRTTTLHPATCSPPGHAAATRQKYKSKI